MEKLCNHEIVSCDDCVQNRVEDLCDLRTQGFCNGLRCGGLMMSALDSG